MKVMLECRTISVTIDRSPKEVYDFVSDPYNLPKWASGLAKSIEQANGQWIVQTPQGPTKIRFVERNNLGVLDHYVSAAPDVEIYIPMRVIANGTGSELVFTLFHLPDMTEQKFEADAEWVRRDLNGLKKILEEKE